MSDGRETIVDIAESSLNKERSGLKFLLIWATSGALLTLLCFALMSSSKETEPRSLGMASNTPKNLLRALVIKAEGNPTTLERWKDFLQRWALYLPCGARSNPVNFENTDIDLFLYLQSNDTLLAQVYRDYWMMGSEGMKLCFRNFVITEDPKPEDGFFMFLDLKVVPLKANWLNKVIAVAQTRPKADFIGARMHGGEGLFDVVGIYHTRKHQAINIKGNATRDTELGDVSDYQLVNKEKTALFSYKFFE